MGDWGIREVGGGRSHKDLRRPDRRTQMKVLVKKKFKFVTSLWDAYVDKNRVNLMLVWSMHFLHSL